MGKQQFTLQELRTAVGEMPFNQLLGMRVARLHDDGVTVEIPMRDDLRNTAGVLHGGVTATIADAAVGIAITRHFRRQRPATTVEMKLNYLRPLADGKIIARSRLRRIGSTLVIGSVDLFDGHRNLVGVALVTYMFLDATTPKRSSQN